MKKLKINGKTDCKYTLVDDEDYDWLSLFNWYEMPNGYIRGYRRGIERRKQLMVLMHRLIMNAPPDKEVDHINHVSHDNQKCNLRIVSPSQNQMNRKATRKTSKYKGVRAKDNRFEAYFCGQYLGRYKTEEEAAIAYDTAVSGSEYSLTNGMIYK